MLLKSVKSIFFLIVVISISCKNTNIPSDIKMIFNATGKNQTELLKVVNHYNKSIGDSLKLKATYYLIRNLNRRSYLDGEQLDQYMNYPKLVLRDLEHGEYIMNSLIKRYAPYRSSSLSVKYDLHEITAKELISNIDAAFYAWEKQTWSKDYSFADFCEYVLPFRVNNEIPEYHRMEILNQYRGILDSASSQKLDAVGACSLLNNRLIEDGWVLSQRVAFLPNYKASDLIKNRIGSCREMVDLATYVMRSAGIPVAVDFIPQWPYRGLGHEWNVVLDKRGKFTPFLGAEDNPGTPHRPKTKKGKIYRKGFRSNPASLAMRIKDDDLVPQFMKDPYLYDVTDEYVNTFTVDIPITIKTKNRFVYLSVFNNDVWVPVCWSEIRDGKAIFSKVEGGIVYTPTYYGSDGVSYLSNPFILQEDGTTNYLDVDTINRIPKLICNRIYPVVPESYILDEVKGAKFQGSNNLNFSNARDLFLFKDRALPSWNDLEVKESLRFRYIRYLPADGKVCHVAEIECYSGVTKISGSISGYDISEKDSVQNVGDGNESSAYSTNKTTSKIVIDLHKKKRITKVRFLPKVSITPQHLIAAGQKYQLKYWLKDKWIPLDMQTAVASDLVFKSVPSRTLFLLTTGGKNGDKRIFTVENTRQKWW